MNFPEEDTNGCFTKIEGGFTLIELSIVLVIIGLIIGGIVVGRDLISAATVRAQISQIEKYQTAINTFRVKYGYLPGDMPDPYATQYGFAARGTGQGQGDGNGIIQSGWFANPIGQDFGETVAFWADLGTAGFVDGAFVGSPNAYTGSHKWPAPKIAPADYMYVYSADIQTGNCNTMTGGNINYISIAPGFISQSNVLAATGLPNITVQQAYGMDTKIDDGLPESGLVTASYVDSQLSCAQPIWVGKNSPGYAIDTSPTAPTSSTCFDNGGVNGAGQKYSMGQNGGAGANCALSFQIK